MQISPETQLFIREHQTDDVRALALQARKYPNVDMPTAITQIAGRQVAAEKIPSWSDMDDMVPEAPITGAMLVRSHRPLQSNPFKR